MKQKILTEKGPLVILFIKQNAMGSLVGNLTLEKIIAILRDSVKVCEDVVKSTGGGIVRVEGHCILMAWSQSDAKINASKYSQIACDVQQRLNKVYKTISGNKLQCPAISISITMGECVFELANHHYRHVFGTPINRVIQMMDQQGPIDENVILVDDSLKEAWSEFDLEDVGSGIYKVRGIRTYL